MKTLIISIVALLQFCATDAFADGAGIEWEILNQEALDLYRSGKYKRALTVAQETLNVAETNVGADYSDVTNSLNILATLRLKLGQDEKAELLYKRALSITEKALGADHPDVASSLNNLAVLYYGQGAVRNSGTDVQTLAFYKGKSARRRPPRCRVQSEQSGDAVSRARALRKSGTDVQTLALYNGKSAWRRSPRRCGHSGQSGDAVSRPRGITQRRSQSTSGRSPYGKKCLAPITQTLRALWTIWRRCIASKDITQKRSQSTSGRSPYGKKCLAPNTQTLHTVWAVWRYCITSKGITQKRNRCTSAPSLS